MVDDAQVALVGEQGPLRAAGQLVGEPDVVVEDAGSVVATVGGQLEQELAQRKVGPFQLLVPARRLGA